MKLTTKILALACVGLLALAGTASAHHGNARATVYAAKLTGTAPIGGRALLVDGKKNNVLVVHVRGLKPNTAYTFEVSGSTEFAAKTVTTNAGGKLLGFAKSATFNATAGTTYTVQVKEGATVVASGDLTPLRKHGHGKHHGPKHGVKHAFAHGHDKRRS
jgi:hypothetical protein